MTSSVPQAQLKQCQELLETESSGEIYLHCIGNAIKRGITLALTLIQESNNGLAYEANTSTIELVGNEMTASVSQEHKIDLSISSIHFR